MREIFLNELGGFRVGNCSDKIGGTGVTALIFERGAVCGLDVRGGGPASRESNLLNPLSAAEKIHAIVLSGGSAYGLDSAGGVMKFLEEKGIGFDTGYAKVPLVCASCIYDLCVGDPTCRPDRNMGYNAAKAAFNGDFEPGCNGVGTGATVGKLLGADYMMKSGLGVYACETGGLKVAAIVAVNALGDVFENGDIICGMYDSNAGRFLNTAEQMYASVKPKGNLFTSNTTIGAVVTNAAFSKSEMNKIAAMASNGCARAINPINTTADGDSIYAASTGEFAADINVVGTLCADAMQKAVVNAVKNSISMYNLKSYSDVFYALG